jgi:hypothetical protein
MWILAVLLGYFTFLVDGPMMLPWLLLKLVFIVDDGWMCRCWDGGSMHVAMLFRGEGFWMGRRDV